MVVFTMLSADGIVIVILEYFVVWYRIICCIVDTHVHWPRAVH